MGDTLVAVVGKKGRVVPPKVLRDRHGWDEGSTLVLVDLPQGGLVMTRAEALSAVRASLSGAGSLADDLISERHAEAAKDAQA
ncbi:MAG: AbrB/MazE/SpoVT family DNA-binding domain-containing protein [Bifidobacteriaceae bacterium]|jgi:AbrB family looped-hinge helix DNA binding protein|nr:AbrB/MazE/SpoVT family DNA-binding domain-containing protein [Bifidobacteriaceae bacterium]